MGRRNRYGFDEPNEILTGGPSHSRAATDDDPPYEPPRQALGFASVDEQESRAHAREGEPLLWDGDEA